MSTKAETDTHISDIEIYFPDEQRFYIDRPDRSAVPLVPVDRLPFRLKGIPAQLSHKQISDGKWKWVASIDEVEKNPKPLVVAPSVSLAPDHNVRTRWQELEKSPTTIGKQTSPKQLEETTQYNSLPLRYTGLVSKPTTSVSSLAPRKPETMN